MEPPKCRTCQAKLRPNKKRASRTVQTPNLVGSLDTHTEDVEEPDGTYGHHNLFCTFMCGYWYGVRCAGQHK
jgi:hypothetical protein